MLENQEKDKRGYCRLPITLPVTVERFNRSNYNQPIKGQTVNISGGGVLLATDGEIGINDSVSVVLDIDGTESIEGTVVRSERADGGRYPYKISVQFAFKIQQQKRRFHKFIEEQQRLSIENKLKEGING